MERLTADKAQELMSGEVVNRTIGDTLQYFYMAIEQSAKANKTHLTVGVHMPDGAARWVRAELERDGYNVKLRGPISHGDTHTFYIRWANSFKIF